MIDERDRPEREHPAGQVVVDVLQEHRCAGGHDGGVREVQLGGLGLTKSADAALVLDRGVARQARDDLRVRSSGKFARSGLRMLALVVVEQEVDVRLVVEGALARPGLRSGASASSTASSLRAACPAGVGSRAVSARRILPARLWVGSPVGLVTSVVVELQRGQRAHHVDDVLAAAELGFSTAFHCAMFSGVKSSLTVWPLSMVTSVTMAWPPNSFW